MASELAAVVEDVGKCYHIYDRPIDRVRQAFVVSGRRRRRLYRDFWALRHVSFDIQRGETVGVIGANGSGKSTLLQLMFGVLQPTEGTVRVHGKVNGLLELGAGFNPEESGRANVLINAAILGVPAAEAAALVDRVAAFADIGDFLDQPIKVYSSGMAVRLGFALQISIPCEVLIIDEALAVGDELFQRKCYGALERFRDGGGTVLFVSHSAASVKQMCRRALFLDHGRLVQQGRCKTVVDHYHKFMYMREPHRSAFREELMATPPVPVEDAPPPRTGVDATEPLATVDRPRLTEHGVERDPPPADYEPGLATQTATFYQPNGATISDARIETPDGRRVNVLNPHQRYHYRYRVDFDAPARGILFGWLVKSTTGLELGGGGHDEEAGFVRHVEPGDAVDVTFAFTASLYPGIYYLNCGVSGTVGDHYGFLHRAIDVVAFRVRNVYTRIHAGHTDLDYAASYTVTRTGDGEPTPAVATAAHPERVPVDV